MTPEDIAALRQALAAGPTPGPWTWWTSCSFRRLSSDATGKDGDVLYAAVHSDGQGDVCGTAATKDFIAAASPDRIARLLDALEAAQRDAERYRWIRQVAEGEAWDGDVCPVIKLYGLQGNAETAFLLKRPHLTDAIDAAMKEQP